MSHNLWVIIYETKVLIRSHCKWFIGSLSKFWWNYHQCLLKQFWHYFSVTFTQHIRRVLNSIYRNFITAVLAVDSNSINIIRRLIEWLWCECCRWNVWGEFQKSQAEKHLKTLVDTLNQTWIGNWPCWMWSRTDWQWSWGWFWGSEGKLLLCKRQSTITTNLSRLISIDTVFCRIYVSLALKSNSIVLLSWLGFRRILLGYWPGRRKYLAPIEKKFLKQLSVLKKDETLYKFCCWYSL